MLAAHQKLVLLKVYGPHHNITKAGNHSFIYWWYNTWLVLPINESANKDHTTDLTFTMTRLSKISILSWTSLNK